MKRMMVRYTVKPERAAENEQYVRDVYVQLQHEQPSGLRYATFKLQDGRSFVHLVSLDADDGQNPLVELAAFKAFTAKIAERCDEPPVATDLTEVGSYRLFGA